MSVYDSAFGTDWTDLARDEILDRAFALSVAAACGRHHPEEYERLQAAVERSYDRSMVGLAYGEGKPQANELRRETTDTDAVWQQLVDEDGDAPLSAAVDRTRPPTRLDLPTSLSRFELLDRSDPDQRESLGLPQFLRRD